MNNDTSCEIYYHLFFGLLERQAEYDPILNTCIFDYKLTLLSILLIVLVGILLIGVIISLVVVIYCKKRKDYRIGEGSSLLRRQNQITLPDLLTLLHRENADISTIIDTYRHFDSRHKKKWKGEILLYSTSLDLDRSKAKKESKQKFSFTLFPSHIYETISETFTVTNVGRSISIEFSTYALFAHKESYKAIFYPPTLQLDHNESKEVVMEIIITKPEIIQGLVVIKGRSPSFTSSEIQSREREYFSPYYYPLKIRGLPLLDSNLIIDAQEIAGGELVGQGAAAAIYRTFYKNKEVAAKKFRIPELTKNDIDEFMREINVFRRVSHPCVMSLLAACTTFPNLTIVMEYLPEGSLKKVLACQNVDPQLKMKFANDAARGLSYLHSLNIIHKDIKSDNFLVVSLSAFSSTNIKVSDFSLSSVYKKENTISKTFEGTIHFEGTIQWASPEVLNGDQHSFSSDVWSYGVVCYEIVTQKIPYSQFRFANEIEKYIRDGNRLELSCEDCKALPDDFREVALSCFTTPSRRPSFQEIALRLAQIRSNVVWSRTLPSQNGRDSGINAIQI